PAHLYCFRDDLPGIVQGPPPPAGHLAFISSSLRSGMQPGGFPDLAVACGPGSQPWLGTTAASPDTNVVVSRPSGRGDGVELGSPDDLQAPINLLSNGISDMENRVWLGSTDPMLKATTMLQDCNGWHTNGTTGVFGDDDSSYPFEQPSATQGPCDGTF